MSENETGETGELGHALTRLEDEGTRERTLSPTGVASAKLVDGVIELSMPNLLPTDNVEEIVEVAMKRIKVPVRIDTLVIKAVDNGYTVKIPNAGRQNMFGPDGSKHVFLDKLAMLEFVGTVIGQVSYQYQEREIEDTKTMAVQADGG